MAQSSLPIGKLPVDLLKDFLGRLPAGSEEVLLGPGVGLDCAVIETSGRLLVVKSDPVTFALDQIGWYTVQVNVNDLATTGATPRWMMVTILLPEENARQHLDRIATQLNEACQSLGITVVGGHTEITHGIGRPILVGTVIGEVSRERLVTPRGALPGDRLLLTKGVPIEATAILAREFSARLTKEPAILSPAALTTAQDFLFTPGLSVLAEARIAVEEGGVHAMHDPTEGGLYTALWEMAEASGHSLRVDLPSVPVFPISKRICSALELDPLAAIASGALLLAVAPEKSADVARAIARQGIACVDIGYFTDERGTRSQAELGRSGGTESPGGPPVVWAGLSADASLAPRPVRDEIAKLF